MTKTKNKMFEIVWNIDSPLDKSLSNHVKDTIEILWNSGLPFLSGALCVLYSPCWVLLFVITTMFKLELMREAKRVKDLKTIIKVCDCIRHNKK